MVENWNGYILQKQIMCQNFLLVTPIILNNLIIPYVLTLAQIMKKYA